MTDTEGGSATRGFFHWFEARFRSPAAIYGLIVFASFVQISSEHSESTWLVLRTAVLTLLIFFVAHVFSHTLTDHGALGLPRAMRNAIGHASGMLYASVPASIVLVVGGIRGIAPDDVVDGAMIVTVIVLAALGYGAFARQGVPIVIRLIGAAGTALLGMLIVLLEYLIH